MNNSWTIACRKWGNATFVGTLLLFGGAACATSDVSPLEQTAEVTETAALQSEEPVDTARRGPHKFEKYAGPRNAAYASSVIYYPTDATPPFGAVVFSPGFTATKESYEQFLGPLLASHGIVMMLTSPTSTSDFPPARAQDLEAAATQIMGENSRAGSPLQGKLEAGRICVTGHSMGGGGTMIAAQNMGNRIKCAVPLQPWEPGMRFPRVTAPVLFIAAQNDTIAGVAQNAYSFYQSLPASGPKYYVEVAGASHFLTTNDLGSAYDTQSKYMVAFYKAYLDGDKRYLDVLNGPKDAALSRYLHAP